MAKLAATALIMALCTTPLAVFAQSARSTHAWEVDRVYTPYSRTSRAITGPIKITGSTFLSANGSEEHITFGNGKTVRLVKESALYRNWDFSGKRQTAEVYRMTVDPGELNFGNQLCGKATVRWIVFWQSYSANTLLLSTATFESHSPPNDINSKGLCETFSYSLNE